MPNRNEVHIFTSRIYRCLAKSVSKDRSFTIGFSHDGGPLKIKRALRVKIKFFTFLHSKMIVHCKSKTIHSRNSQNYSKNTILLQHAENVKWRKMHLKLI